MIYVGENDLMICGEMEFKHAGSESLRIGDRLFLFHREVIVIKTYLIFHLVRVRYLDETTEFCIDYHTLSSQPDYTNSIGISKLRGGL